MYMTWCWCFGSMGGLYYSLQVVELLVHIMIGWGEALGGCYYCLSLHMNTTKMRVKKSQKTGDRCCVIIPSAALCWCYPVTETSPWVLCNGCTFNYWSISFHMECRVDTTTWRCQKCPKNQCCVKICPLMALCWCYPATNTSPWVVGNDCTACCWGIWWFIERRVECSVDVDLDTLRRDHGNGVINMLKDAVGWVSP